jgi:hypothetical protein
MNTSVEPFTGLAHDAMDSLVAKIASICEGLFTRNESARAAATESDVAFSDEWERKQIAHELHFN